MKQLLRFLTCLALATVLALPAWAEDVTYDEILASPDDIDLNFLYAQQQVIKGDLEQASAALERVLLIQPNYDSARLFYALVLFRLDDMQGAKRELELLQDRPLSPGQQAEVRKYLARASARAKTTRVTGYVSTGLRVDSNPDLTTEAVTDLNGNQLSTDSQTDGSFLANAGFRIEHDLPGGSGSYAFIETFGNLNQQFAVSEADYAIGGIKAGTTFFVDDLELTAYGFSNALSLEQQFYRAAYGGGVQATYAFDPRFSVFLGAWGSYQDFQRISDDSAGSARDGWLGSVSTGFSYRTSETNKFSFWVNGYLKDSSNESYSYDAIELVASDTVLLGRGQYIKGTVSYRWLNYKEPNPIYSPILTQNDRLLKARLAYGAPLGTLFEFIGVETADAIADINFQAGVNYLDQESNIPNFIASSLSADVLLTKRFAY